MSAPDGSILGLCPLCDGERLHADALGVQNVLLTRDLFERASFGQIEGVVYLNGIAVNPAIVYQASMGPHGWIEIIGTACNWFMPPDALGLPPPGVCPAHRGSGEFAYYHHILFGDVRAEFSERGVIAAR